MLAETWRGPLVEAVIRGHVAVVDSAGRLVAAAGDPDTVLPARSTLKPLQALAFLRRAADRLGAGEDEVAVACGSHRAEPVHLAAVRRLLARVSLDESALACGAQPRVRPAGDARLPALHVPRRIDNNCSGKHAAMLATCVVEGWPVDDYTAPRHPAQRAVASAIREECGLDLDRWPFGVDGCGLPTHGMPLRVLAAAFAHAAWRSAGFARAAASMAAAPRLVGGTGTFDTVLIGEIGERLVGKVGGAACWVGVSRSGGGAVALKLESGSGEHVPPVALAVLSAAGLLAEVTEPLAGFAEPPLRTWAGEVAGRTTARVVLRPSSRVLSPS